MVASLSPVSKLLKTAITTSNSASVNSPSSDPDCGVGEDITIDYNRTGPKTNKNIFDIAKYFLMLNIFSVCVLLLQVRGSEGEWARCAEVGSRCGCPPVLPWRHGTRLRTLIDAAHCALCSRILCCVLPSAASDGKYRYHDAIFVLELPTKFREKSTLKWDACPQS